MGKKRNPNQTKMKTLTVLDLDYRDTEYTVKYWSIVFQDSPCLYRCPSSEDRLQPELASLHSWGTLIR